MQKAQNILLSIIPGIVQGDKSDSLLYGSAIMARRYLGMRISMERHYILDVMRVTPRDAIYIGLQHRFCVLRPELVASIVEAESTKKSPLQKVPHVPAELNGPESDDQHGSASDATVGIIVAARKYKLDSAAPFQASDVLNLQPLVKHSVPSCTDARKLMEAGKIRMPEFLRVLERELAVTAKTKEAFFADFTQVKTSFPNTELSIQICASSQAILDVALS